MFPTTISYSRLHIVKISIFMQLMSDFLKVNQYNVIRRREIGCKKNQSNVGIYYGEVDICDKSERWVVPPRPHADFQISQPSQKSLFTGYLYKEV